MTDLSLFWDESGEAGTSLNIKTHDAHVAELAHQSFGIFGRFSGFDVSGTHGIEGGSQVGRVLGPDRGPDAGAGMAEFELHGVQPLPVKSQGLRQHRIGTIHGSPHKGCPIEEKCTRI